MSSPLPIPFPLLADVDAEVHQVYNMDQHPGLVLLDRKRLVRAKWLVPDERVWPKMQDLISAIDAL
jgi:alkyl hydroperoxide reductase subunit AhpC